MENRKQRRLEAKKNKTTFEPQYSTGKMFDRAGKTIVTGGEPKTFEQMYGIGYERFNNKFVTIKEVKEIVEIDEELEVEQINDDVDVEKVDNTEE